MTLIYGCCGDFEWNEGRAPCRIVPLSARTSPGLSFLVKIGVILMTWSVVMWINAMDEGAFTLVPG